jgi:hypothetical protein
MQGVTLRSIYDADGSTFVKLHNAVGNIAGRSTCTLPIMQVISVRTVEISFVCHSTPHQSEKTGSEVFVKGTHLNLTKVTILVARP